jgi:hypothetical protein
MMVLSKPANVPAVQSFEIVDTLPFDMSTGLVSDAAREVARMADEVCGQLKSGNRGGRCTAHGHTAILSLFYSCYGYHSLMNLLIVVLQFVVRKLPGGEDSGAKLLVHAVCHFAFPPEEALSISSELWVALSSELILDLKLGLKRMG